MPFSNAEAVLYDPDSITREDEGAQGEQRLVTSGLDALGRLLVVVYTYRNETSPLISARNEVRAYERSESL